MQKTRYSPALIYAAVALWAIPVQAAEEGQVPQLDPTFYAGQLFWLAISFGLLYLMMKYVAVPAVQKTQDTRAGVIAGDLAAAQKANDDAKAMMANYEKALSDARAKAQQVIGEIAAQAAKQSAEKQATQHKELAKRLAEAEAKITAARDAAIRDVKSSAAELATAIIDKVTKSGAHYVA